MGPSAGYCCTPASIKQAGKITAELNSRDIDIHRKITEEDNTLLEKAMTLFKLSARAYHRILKIARTIADLDNNPEISMAHLSEALSSRTLHRLQ